MSRVVVVGASRGLGRALAIRYLELGAEVWAGCRTPVHATDLAQRGAHVRRLDVADESLVATFAEQIPGGVDVLINAADIDARALGAAADRRGPFDLSVQHFLAQLQVNAAGPMIVTRALLPQLRHDTPGKVINLSLRTASMIVGAEVCWDIGYNASKAALNAITVRTARLVQCDGVVVVAIHPGWIRTDMGGPEADLSPHEAAAQLVKTINDLDIEQTGRFLQRDGSPHPW